ncbi:hypothetical protein OOK31_17960 [Streptomyces sp. NBC_00249]|uniref:hypothetical protein n=1 Tax=Streptomyces sp. NBC_00249 TaxID=2975690 RepID=UPI0022507E9A|nr:hypothetical protein [Streptomyces sp. NBC_00249]MCX5195759.1 hypothetical protein [Streptomyces sp. NBC_00249]
MTLSNPAAKTRFLVLHDYGMGGSWWWVHARSAREVLETFAWTEVVTRQESVTWAEGDKLEEVDIDAPLMPPGLDDLRAKRDVQRGLPGFGALADRSIVYVRRHWDGEDDGGPVYLMEVESDGRRTREVELAEDGSGRIRSGPDDWPFNPPVVDFFDPELAGQEITREEFEEQWERAVPASGL